MSARAQDNAAAGGSGGGGGVVVGGSGPVILENPELAPSPRPSVAWVGPGLGLAGLGWHRRCWSHYQRRSLAGLRTAAAPVSLRCCWWLLTHSPVPPSLPPSYLILSHPPSLPSTPYGYGTYSLLGLRVLTRLNEPPFAMEIRERQAKLRTCLITRFLS